MQLIDSKFLDTQVQIVLWRHGPWHYEIEYTAYKYPSERTYGTMEEAREQFDKRFNQYKREPDQG